jgi:predicted transcriptional regulator
MATVNPIQVQKFLKGIDYPVSKEDLIAHAEENGADDNVLDTLEQIEEDEFETPADVSKAIGEIE